MSTPLHSPAPASATTNASARSRRLTAIDATRGLAVLGMIAVHSLYAYDDTYDPTWTYKLSAGRASAIFAVLAGVGIAFISHRRRQVRGPQATATAWSLVARAVMVGLIGLTLGFTDSEYGVVILGYYAVMFLLAIPLIYLGTRALAAVAVALAVATPVVSQFLRPHLPEPLGAQPSFDALWQEPLRLLSDLAFTGEFPATVWMTYVCVGLLVGRLNLTAFRTAATLAASGMALMLASSALSWVVLYPMGGLGRLEAAEGTESVSDILTFGADGTVPTSSWWWLGVASPHTGTPLDLMATVGSSLLVLGAMLLLGHVTHRFWARAITVALAPLAAIGSLSLTVYVGHILFVNSDFDVYSPWSGYIRQLVFMFAFALVWRATAGRGPLEGLVAFVTNRVKRASLRRSTGAGITAGTNVSP